MFKDIVRSCRKKIREAKAQLDINLATSIKDNKNIYINTLMAKGGSREMSILYWTCRTWTIVTEDEEKAEVFNNSLAPVVISETGHPSDN